MASSRKFWVALFGIGILFLERKYHVDLGGAEEYLADIVMAATPMLVWLVPNHTPEA